MMAAMQNGWSEVEAITKDELSPLERTIMEFHENLYRKDMTWDEAVAIKARIHELRTQQNPDQKQYQTAAELHDSFANISRDLTLAEELVKNPELKKASSKKAAMRMVSMEKHLTRLENKQLRSVAHVATIRDAMVTADARDWLRLQPTASTDLVYSDPPWGIDYFKQGHKEVATGADGSLGASEFDDTAVNVRDIIVDVIPEMIRITEETGWIILHCGFDALKEWTMLFEACCTKHFLYKDDDTHEKDGCKYLKAEDLPWAWYRPNSQNPARYPERHVQNVYEYLLVVNRGAGRLLQEGLTNMLVYDADYGDRIHAHQKPLALCEDILSRVTFAGYSVVDPFFGSGALLAAAAKTQRKFRGCELNPLMLAPALGYVSQFYTGD
jgi:DNA modification methylase